MVAVMALGTAISRLSGFLRLALLAAALGPGLRADVFTIANTVPNMLYILLAGGVFNAVLVPQLVRAMHDDPDGGAGYVDRVLTLALLFLGAVTVVLVLAAPLVMAVLLDGRFGDPALTQQRDSAVALARYCLPQVFFYGMFVLVGQVLNARGRFAPMMWAPIANNAIAVGVLVTYLLVFGPTAPDELQEALSPGAEALLGLGSTLGIGAQLAILIPYLRSAGIRFRPRFDFRGTGLGRTARLGVWTVLFVCANQAAYVVVVRLASGGTVDAADGTGITVYSGAYLVVLVPHSIVTVSLATAALPRLADRAAAGDVFGLAADLRSTVRSALVVAVPFAALLPVIATPLSRLAWGHGATAELYPRFEAPLVLFGVGLIFFTVHYVTLRGYYALELNRDAFAVQLVIATVNVSAALVLVRCSTAANTTAMLVVAYGVSYAVGSVLAVSHLARRLGRSSRAAWMKFVAKLCLCTLLLAAAAVATSAAVRVGSDDLISRPPWPFSVLEVVFTTGVASLAFIAAARLVGLREADVRHRHIFSKLSGTDSTLDAFLLTGSAQRRPGVTTDEPVRGRQVHHP